jgi:hypothetical protein
MSKITYTENVNALRSETRVYSGNLRIGTIRIAEGGWRYFPKGSKVGGEIFTTVSAVKRSLEN